MVRRNFQTIQQAETEEESFEKDGAEDESDISDEERIF